MTEKKRKGVGVGCVGRCWLLGQVVVVVEEICGGVVIFELLDEG